jgi:hypothetical protein
LVGEVRDELGVDDRRERRLHKLLEPGVSAAAMVMVTVAIAAEVVDLAVVAVDVVVVVVADAVVDVV